jgi:hypothetical protein
VAMAIAAAIAVATPCGKGAIAFHAERFEIE